MGKTRKLLAMSLLAILVAGLSTPLILTQASADEGETETSSPVTLSSVGNLTYIQNDLVTIVFPAGGQKPMFLWWYTGDPSNINVVKFKGLIEYGTYEKPYFLWRCENEPMSMKDQIEHNFVEPKMGMGMSNGMHMGQISGILDEIGDSADFHPPYLPFSGSKWRMDGPENVTRGDVKYLSFNFTLVDVPGHRGSFDFADNNIIIRSRFYYTSATEDVYGKYTYTVNAGELKIDIVIKRWDWNVDKLSAMIQALRGLGLNIPEGKAGLALWINLASINLTKLQAAHEDAEEPDDVDHTESASTASAMYVEDQKVPVIQNNTSQDAMPMQNHLRDDFRVRFETDNATTFAGYFKFVPQAIVTDGTTYNTTDVTASYVQAGGHLQLFIGYPYFGNLTLEHDPSIGVESVSSWLSINLLAILIGATIAIAVALAAVKMRKKTVNIVSIQ